MKPSYLKTGLYTIATIALLFCSTQNHAQQYYKWVDANGSTHYTTTPPPKGAKRLNKVSTYGGNQPTQAPATTANQATQQAQNAAQHVSQVANVAVEAAATTSPPAQAPSAPSHSDR